MSAAESDSVSPGEPRQEPTHRGLDGFDLGLCAATFCLCAGLAATPVARSIENRLLDLRVRLAAPTVRASPDIVLVTIDDRSLLDHAPEFGRWPWPRSAMAEVIATCADATTIALDIIFPEHDRHDAEGDATLSRIVADHGGVISSIYFDNGASPLADEQVLSQLGVSQNGAPLKTHLTSASWLAPYPSLRTSSAHLGHVNYVTEFDGVLRGHSAVLGVGKHAVPSLALAAVAHFDGMPLDQVHRHSTRLALRGRDIPIDALGRFLVRPSGKLPERISIGDVLSAARSTGADTETLRMRLRDKLVFIGSTATGLEADRQVTPWGSYVPGVVNTAIAADNLLTGLTFRRTSHALAAVLLLLTCVLPGLLRVQRPLTMVGIALSISTAYIATALTALFAWRLMLPVAVPVLGTALSCASLGVRRWRFERRRRRELERLDAAKQLITDMLVHDMRNQIQPVMMSLDLLTMQMEEDSDLATVTNSARMTTKRLTMLINGLLDVRKMEQGLMQIDRQPCDPIGIVNETIHEFEIAATTAGLSICYVTPDVTSRPWPMDAHVFSRIVENLVWNAIQHAPRDSRIELGCDFVGDARFSLWVANQGAPIPEELRQALFRPFVSGDASRKVFGKGGTGLGLAFCRMAIDAHDGTIEIISPCYDDGGVKVVVTISAID